MNLSAHFTLEELIASDYAIRHGISNMPTDPDVLESLHTLAMGLERVRTVLNLPMHISSGYRSPKVNTGVGGAKTSAHIKGLAADFVLPGVAPIDVCRALVKREDIYFDKLIQEGTWTHIAFPEPESEPAGIVLTAIFKGGQVSYVKGLA